MPELFDAIEPYATHTLPVSAGHRLYVEECGRRDGIPVVFVHGGPGAGCEPWHRRFFNPEVYRIILFDQRGCGRSVPHAELDGNDTASLVADMEAIRELLGIERWVVFGGSWGSTLGLVYAETHPECVLGLILRGIFLCRPRDIHWFYQEGASFLLPERWQAKAWSLWEAHASTLLPKAAVVDHFGNPHTALSLARIECHYFMHDSFLQQDQILDNVHRLRDIPGVIVHGRYDVVCPVEQAWLLQRAWPGAELRVVPDAGHSALEPGIVDALVRATEQTAMRLR